MAKLTRDNKTIDLFDDKPPATPSFTLAEVEELKRYPTTLNKYEMAWANEKGETSLYGQAWKGCLKSILTRAAKLKLTAKGKGYVVSAAKIEEAVMPACLFDV
jgi:hypothetical protein